MNSILLTEPTAEPITLAEAKAHLAIDFSDHDEMISAMITAARRHIEQRTRRALVRQKWRIYLDSLSASEIALEPPPVQEIAQMQYIDGTTSPATQTIAPTVYELDKPRQVLRLAYGQTWPAPRYQHNAAWVDVWSGYYDSTASPINTTVDVPTDLRYAILMLVEDLFSNRGVQSEIVLNHNRTAEALMRPYWVPNL